MIIFLLVLIFLAILWPGLIRWTLTPFLVIGLFSIHAHAATNFQTDIYLDKLDKTLDDWASPPAMKPAI